MRSAYSAELTDQMAHVNRAMDELETELCAGDPKEECLQPLIDAATEALKKYNNCAKGIKTSVAAGLAMIMLVVAPVITCFYLICS